MKKTLLLSVVASTMIMAGGDIAPVEPVVEAPAAVASGWEFGGTGVLYYQTNDTETISGAATGDLFDQDASAATAGIQLRAVNTDVVAGIGAGIEVSGLATLGLENDVVSATMQTANGGIQGGWISQSYLTYGINNTSIKAGRQALSQSISPFAYSENWNVFANTFDAVTVVNTDIANTTIVGGWIFQNNANGMHADMANYAKPNGNDGIYMLTVQNKSIADLTLTGTVYYGQDMAGADDVTIWWGDAAYNAGSFGVAIQGGTEDAGLADDMTAFGAKLTAGVSGINLMAAYSTVSDGAMNQLGGETSALYTNTVLDQINGSIVNPTTGNGLTLNEDKIVVGANMDAVGGNIAATYANSTNDTSDYNEVDIAYSTNLTDSVNLTAAYVWADADELDDSINVVRVVGSYKF